jgi:phosphate transport system substrate-binding protein
MSALLRRARTRARDRGAALLALALLATATSARAQSDAAVLVVKGSDTIGEHLGQDLAESCARSHPGLQVRWESIGSSSAFVGLLDGSAALGASSRGIKPEELERAHELGIELREYVIGYDGIAVIAHPDNPVSELTLAQLAAIFRRREPSWSDFGGRALAVHRISRPSYSGTHSFFKDAVLRRTGAKSAADFAPSTEMVEETDEILRKVAADPAAISYVGLGFVDESRVKLLRVRLDESAAGVEPDARSIRDGSYPIFRPLYLYARTDAPPDARRLIALALSETGRALVAARRFIPPDPTPVLAGEEAAVDLAADFSTGAHREPVRILFGVGGTVLPDAARAQLETLADMLREGRAHATLVGHSDSRGDAAANRALSLARAGAVARALESRGVPAQALRVEGRASDEPAATNRTQEGRRQNRRVDVFVSPVAR